ncbi:unnamed protein product, partial [Linum tenue]
MQNLSPPPSTTSHAEATPPPERNSSMCRDAECEVRVANVTRNAAVSEGVSGFFGVAEVGGRAYALAQCWESVGRDGCWECLGKAAAAVVGRCLPRREGRALNAGDSTLGVIMAIALASAAFAMLTLFAAYAVHLKRLKAKQARRNLGKVSISFNRLSMDFKYETLEKATDYFSLSKKLGQGGAGTVFIGSLPNNQTVAVKRLIFNTSQWVEEFFNEVNLISGIQHKNLVKLLGCSIEGPESLPVYTVLCLDEATTGLDNAAAFFVVEALPM